MFIDSPKFLIEVFTAVFPRFRERPQIVTLWVEWLGRFKQREVALS